MPALSSQVVRRGNTLTWLARLLAVDQSYLQQADLRTLTWELWLKASGKTTLLDGPTDLDPSEVIFDVLQSSYGWDLERDPLGYNFRLTISGDLTDTGPQLVVVLRSVDGEYYPGVIELPFSTDDVP